MKRETRHWSLRAAPSNLPPSPAPQGTSETGCFLDLSLCSLQHMFPSFWDEGVLPCVPRARCSEETDILSPSDGETGIHRCHKTITRQDQRWPPQTTSKPELMNLINPWLAGVWATANCFRLPVLCQAVLWLVVDPHSHNPVIDLALASRGHLCGPYRSIQVEPVRTMSLIP